MTCCCLANLLTRLAIYCIATLIINYQEKILLVIYLMLVTVCIKQSLKLKGSDYMKREVQTRVAFRIYPNDKKEMNKLRKRLGLVWPTFAKYVNRLVKEDLNKRAASDLNKLNREEN